MKSLYYSMIVIVMGGLFIGTNSVYAPCIEGPGNNCNNYPPPALDQIKFDKRNYEISERPVAEITGVPQTLVHLEVDDQSGYVMLLRDFNLSSNGTASITIDTSLYRPGVYLVSATSSISKIIASFSIGLTPSGQHIVLETARNTYFSGDIVAILGSYQPNALYQISLLDPNGIEQQRIQIMSNNTGHFASSDIQIPKIAIPGVWMISATSGVVHTNIRIKVISFMEIGPTNDVDVTNIKTQPPIIKVGDNFSITATFVNNSPYATNVEIDPCGDPFPIHFDDHVKIEHVPNMTCPLFFMKKKIYHGENMTQTSPGLPITTAKPTTPLSQTVFFRAIKAGAENSIVSFSYNMINQTDPNHLQIQKTASKSFLFMIYDNKTMFSALSNVDKSDTYTIDSPLKQIKSGIKSEDVQCDTHFQLVLKGTDNSPACIKDSDVSDFILKDWATRTANVENTDQSFGYSIIGGQLGQAKADLGHKSLVLSVITTGNGTLVTHLPRSLIDPHINGQDSAFVVLEDGHEVSYKQAVSSIAQRTLSIPFLYGVSTIEIIAPEPIR